MASSKEMQLRAKMKKIAAKAAANPFKIAATGVGGMKAFVLTPEGEATKSLRVCQNDRMPARTYSNAQDLAMFTEKFPNNAAGWFYALIPMHADGKIRASKEGREQIGDFRVTKFNSRYYLLSTYCSWDFAITHYNQVLNNFDFALVGFSTPQHLQTLCENPENY